MEVKIMRIVSGLFCYNVTKMEDRASFECLILFFFQQVKV